MNDDTTDAQWHEQEQNERQRIDDDEWLERAEALDVELKILRKETKVKSGVKKWRHLW